MIKTFDKLPSYIQQKFQEVWFDPSKSESAKVEVKGKLAKIFLLIDGDRSFCILEQNTSKQLLLNLFKTEKEPWKIWSTINTLPKDDFTNILMNLDFNDPDSDKNISFMFLFTTSYWSWWSFIRHKKTPKILVEWETFKVETLATHPRSQKEFEEFNSVKVVRNGIINHYNLATQEFINQK